MDLLELFFRFGALGQLLLAAAVLLRIEGRYLSARLTALFFTGTGGYLICSSPINIVGDGMAAQIAYAFCRMNAVFFWLFAQSLFVDGFRLRAGHWGLIVAMVAFGYLAYPWALDSGLSYGRTLAVAYQVCELALALHALWIVWRGYGGDLVEARRRLRTGIVVVAGFYVAVVVSVEGAILAAPGAAVPRALETLNAGAIFFITFAILTRLLGIGVADLFGNPLKPKDPVDPGGQPDGLAEKLDALVREEKVYLREGLTIGALAERLAVPEYRLRRLINGALDQRNFSSYLNGFRLAAAKERLADPDEARIPILTIALESGFASIGPFNRAFREQTGLTPSEFRQKSFTRT